MNMSRIIKQSIATEIVVKSSSLLTFFSSCRAALNRQNQYCTAETILH